MSGLGSRAAAGTDMSAITRWQLVGGDLVSKATPYSWPFFLLLEALRAVQVTGGILAVAGSAVGCDASSITCRVAEAWQFAALVSMSESTADRAVRVVLTLFIIGMVVLLMAKAFL